MFQFRAEHLATIPILTEHLATIESIRPVSEALANEVMGALHAGYERRAALEAKIARYKQAKRRNDALMTLMWNCVGCDLIVSDGKKRAKLIQMWPKA